MTNTDLSPLLASLEALEKRATPAPWAKTPENEKNDVCLWAPDGRWLANVGNWARCVVHPSGADMVQLVEKSPNVELVETEHDANAELLVALRNAYPELSAALRAALAKER